MRVRGRRVIGLISIVILLATWIVWSQAVLPPTATHQVSSVPSSLSPGSPALTALDNIPVKGHAAKTGYARTQFGDGWTTTAGCDTRNIILKRDMTNTLVGEGCKVESGTLDDPYTSKTIQFVRGANTSDAVQIDHVVALGNAWQTGAQQLDRATRIVMANDPLELLAVDGTANQQKSDSDAASWLPSNKPFRCQYVARQVAVKLKYHLWVTQAEKDAISRVLSGCPTQTLPAGA